MRIVIAAALCVACNVSAPGPATGRPVATGTLSEVQLDDLRDVVERLASGMSRAEVEAALGERTGGLAVLGTGPEHEVTEIYALGGRNVLWLTWDARDPSSSVLRRATVWNEATDPVPTPLPYPP